MKLRKRKNTEIELSGQDSFLDLVSNIVGILVILVMVAGIRAQYSSASVDDAPKVLADARTLADLDEKYQELQTKEEAALRLRMDIEDVQRQSEIVAEQLLLQSREYATLFDFMTSMRAGIELAAEEKSQSFKDKIEYQRQLMETNTKLEQIDKARNFFRQTRPKATVLENIPTPLSRTVETKEIHLRLLGGRIVFIPLDELIIQLRGHIGEEKNRYFKQPASVGKVGPIDNFELEFLLAMVDLPMQGGSEIRLQYAEANPTHEPLGHPLRQALAPQSEFRRKLSTFQKDIYTVTIWLYPDSFEEYQELKQFLHEQGYTAAVRPMQMDSAIGISPYGTKSSTQ
ncbi:MAG: hypothetical protein LBI05_01940 [Planctomycetaceae bacterium]|jgi:hypothetical protein|nr:hypothetical protein [Planctomycetaceae bacterium]